MSPDEARGIPLQSGDDSGTFAVGTFAELEIFPEALNPHRHALFEVMYISEGSGLCVIDFESLVIVPPALCVTAPGEVHFWRPESDLRGWGVMFSADFLLPELRNIDPRMIVRLIDDLCDVHLVGLPEAQDALVHRLFLDMEEEVRDAQEHYPTAVRALLTYLLVQAHRLRQVAGGPPVRTEHPLLARFRQLLAEEVPPSRSVAECARRLGVSESHLADITRRGTGKSPGALVREAVTLAAKRLLALTDLSVSQASTRLGFEDPSYFSRYFRREVGMSATEFRRQIRDKYQIPDDEDMARQLLAP
ncbi:helix-turn-helix domain-containing protein [Nostocoides japonicum]|nr:AraC family transcriptional regulator [Tetrasphaera japonica]